MEPFQAPEGSVYLARNLLCMIPSLSQKQLFLILEIGDKAVISIEEPSNSGSHIESTNTFS